MPIFEQFPYTNLHELNLDWVLDQIRKLQEDLKEIEALQSITYADPLQWDITSQYTKNTIVVNGYNAYLSKQAVPQNISINNTDYWMLVGDFIREFDDLRKQITANTESTDYASGVRYVGDLVIVNKILYRVIQPMTVGTQYVVGGNIRHITIEELVKNVYYPDTETLEIFGTIGGQSVTVSGDRHVYDGATSTIEILKGE